MALPLSIIYHLYLYINIIHYFLHYVKRFVLYFCKSFCIGFQSVPAYRSSFFPCQSVHGSCSGRYTYLATSDPLNGTAMSINRGLSRASLPRFYFIYYLYNYYTSFLAVCQEKCSLIFKKFLSSPALINWATNYSYSAISVAKPAGNSATTAYTPTGAPFTNACTLILPTLRTLPFLLTNALIAPLDNFSTPNASAI